MEIYGRRKDILKFRRITGFVRHAFSRGDTCCHR